jgi:hypothetical protein
MSSSGGVRVPISKCQICSKEAVIHARCQLCYAGACDNPDCVKLIQDPRMCWITRSRRQKREAPA